MNTHFEKLLVSASQPLCSESPDRAPIELEKLDASLALQLVSLLKMRNGFFAFPQSLTCLSVRRNAAGYDLTLWNNPETWTHAYDCLTDEYIFFAEDIFGEQFALKGDLVYRFNPETGEFSEFANDLESWAQKIVRDPDLETGRPLSIEWQKKSVLRDTERLLPKRLFVIGGDYNIDNLFAMDALEGMKFRAEIANQISSLPDGTEITFEH